MSARCSWVLALVCAIASSMLTSFARADGAAFVHVVRPGETLASIAQRYYGDPRREGVLVAENGLTTQGGAAIVVGLRLVIPRVTYHRVHAGETWGQIATAHYGDPRRMTALIEANPQVSGVQPDEGAELLVPYPLRHVARQTDTLQHLAELYYGDEEKISVLMRFNALPRRRLERGQVVLVPLADLVLSEEGRQVIEGATGESVNGGEVRGRQRAIDEDLPRLRDDVRSGRYTEAVALGNRLLGAGELTGNQMVTIQRELATAYIALERTELAEHAFVAALRRQPDLALDTRLTSPTVLRAFQHAQAELAVSAPPPQQRRDRGSSFATKARRAH